MNLRLATVLLLALIATSCNQSNSDKSNSNEKETNQVVNFDEVQEYVTVNEFQGIKVYSLKGVPFTGMAERFYDNGSIMYRTSFKDGKQDGLAQEFFKDGEIALETTWKEGKQIK